MAMLQHAQCIAGPHPCGTVLSEGWQMYSTLTKQKTAKKLYQGNCMYDSLQAAFTLQGMPWQCNPSSNW